MKKSKRFFPRRRQLLLHTKGKIYNRKRRISVAFAQFVAQKEIRLSIAKPVSVVEGKKEIFAKAGAERNAPRRQHRRLLLRQPQRQLLKKESVARRTRTLSPEAITGFENYPPKVQQLLNSALELTTRNLDYKYGSADPDNGGMDCSGFVYFVLKQNGVDDVPRDSSEQYIWLRRAGKFEPVVSRKEEFIRIR